MASVSSDTVVSTDRSDAEMARTGNAKLSGDFQISHDTCHDSDSRVHKQKARPKRSSVRERHISSNQTIQQKSICWHDDQLLHVSPETTLRTYPVNGEPGSDNEIEEGYA